MPVRKRVSTNEDGEGWDERDKEDEAEEEEEGNTLADDAAEASDGAPPHLPPSPPPDDDDDDDDGNPDRHPSAHKPSPSPPPLPPPIVRSPCAAAAASTPRLRLSRPDVLARAGDSGGGGGSDDEAPEGYSAWWAEGDDSGGVGSAQDGGGGSPSPVASPASAAAEASQNRRMLRNETIVNATAHIQQYLLHARKSGIHLTNADDDDDDCADDDDNEATASRRRAAAAAAARPDVGGMFLPPPPSLPTPAKPPHPAPPAPLPPQPREASRSPRLPNPRQPTRRTGAGAVPPQRRRTSSVGIASHAPKPHGKTSRLLVCQSLYGNTAKKQPSSGRTGRRRRREGGGGGSGSARVSPGGSGAKAGGSAAGGSGAGASGGAGGGGGGGGGGSGKDASAFSVESLLADPIRYLDTLGALPKEPAAAAAAQGGTGGLGGSREEKTLTLSPYKLPVSQSSKDAQPELTRQQRNAALMEYLKNVKDAQGCQLFELDDHIMEPATLYRLLADRPSLLRCFRAATFSSGPPIPSSVHLTLQHRGPDKLAPFVPLRRKHQMRRGADDGVCDDLCVSPPLAVSAPSEFTKTRAAEPGILPPSIWSLPVLTQRAQQLQEIEGEVVKRQMVSPLSEQKPLPQESEGDVLQLPALNGAE